MLDINLLRPDKGGDPVRDDDDDDDATTDGWMDG